MIFVGVEAERNGKNATTHNFQRKSYMFNHQPIEYDCPFCSLVSGSNKQTSQQEDIIYQDQQTLAFISAKWWINNPGNVIIIPKQHRENIYDITDEQIASVYKTAKKVALAIRLTY